jgi:outer membrane protein OmpA-like peptidoglycan-associated protein
VEDGGRRTVIREPGNRTIIREGNRTVIRHDETDRLRRAYGGAVVRRERRGADEVVILRRPNGIEVVTVYDQRGNLLRRSRRDPGGREIVLIQNVLVGGPAVYEEFIELPPPVIRIPREQYIVDVEDASQDEIYEALTAPPIERLDRSYTLDQVRRSPTLRERVRRVDIDTITFDFGSWELSDEQALALTGVAEAINRAIEQNPNEVFLVEGYTDAVGDELDNLTLSDRRAETVARLLTEIFDVPAENLTSQGFGEQYLKINTQEPERQNRRVTIRRITPLLNQEAAR